MMLVTMEGRGNARESLDIPDPYLAPALEPINLLGCHMIVRNTPQGPHIDSCSTAFLVRGLGREGRVAAACSGCKKEPWPGCIATTRAAGSLAQDTWVWASVPHVWSVIAA